MLHIEERNSFYSLWKKYERNMPNHNIRTKSKSKLRKLIRDEFNTLSKTQVSSFPKADTYREFKNRVRLESYLSDIKNRKYRVTFTKFRLSDYGLMIEKGRHKRPKIPREQRFCPFYPANVEDENHSLMQCILYENRN